MKAKICTEYVAFNKTPTGFLGDNLDLIEGGSRLFTDPIRVFGFGKNALTEAERWVREANALRAQTRAETRFGLEVDNIAGQIIDVEVRQRMVIFGEYEQVPDLDEHAKEAEKLVSAGKSIGEMSQQELEDLDRRWWR